VGHRLTPKGGMPDEAGGCEDDEAQELSMGIA